MPVKSVEELTEIYRALAHILGASKQEEDLFARSMVRADTRGMYTQGAAAVPYLVSLINNGLMSFGVPFTVIRDELATAVVDGGHGVGAVVATKAMNLAIEKASHAGIGTVWVKNGGDFAMASNHAMQALEHDHVGIAMRNGSPRVAPWGGRKAFFGTDPIAVAIPSDKEESIVIDMASGSFSVGQVVMAARDRRKMQSAHLVDKYGNYTDDPLSIIVNPADRESIFSGAISSLGLKGYLWLLIVELFSGLLAGTGPSNKNDFQPTPDRTWNEGMCFMSIDVSKLQPVQEFKAAADEFVRALKAVEPVKGVDRVKVPGERGANNERECRTKGVPVREEDWNELIRTAQSLGINIEKLKAKRFENES